MVDEADEKIGRRLSGELGLSLGGDTACQRPKLDPACILCAAGMPKQAILPSTKYVTSSLS